jgi:hypothetical protein
MIIGIWPLNLKDVDEKTTPSKVFKDAKIIIIFVLIKFLTFSFWVLDQLPFMANFSSLVILSCPLFQVASSSLLSHSCFMFLSSLHHPRILQTHSYFNIVFALFKLTLSYIM